jgi:hypothetical protein
MKVLLDESVPRKFRNHLTGHDCCTVPEEGLASKKNGELLSFAEKSGFEVFLTLIVVLSLNKTCKEEPSRLSWSMLNQTVWQIFCRMALKFCECLVPSGQANS